MKKPSVTQLIDLLNKPALLNWANKIGLQGTSLSDHRKQSRSKGSNYHNQIENALKFGESFEEENVQFQFDKFIMGKEVVAIEKSIETEWFTGRLDFAFKSAGLIWVSDFKSSQGIYLETILQLTAYKMSIGADKICVVEIPNFNLKEIPVKDFSPYENILKALHTICMAKAEVGL